ncbi:TM2 domain-containing protein [Erythrobacter insulae]|uniref:TM2 domain-containing protein n=1 Tax=Erythrobacter insulae TaxID=2584124 RepID=A0A547P8M3_9SPHN|nr:TM2 domain-containing protein [Erythrobacter insulae]TRD10505.1 TM2 domain-containing protein [Erythrobacter insulae]
MGFGRKGMSAKEAGAQDAAIGSASTFGGQAQPSADEVAARREAFIASERANKSRRLNPTSFSPSGSNAPRSTTFDHLADEPRAARPLAAGFRRSSPVGQSAKNRPNSGLIDKVFGPPKKRHVVIAYLFWFILAQVSAHRFYCGDTKGGLAQTGTFFTSLCVLIIVPEIGMLGLGIWLFWILTDLFLIPGLLHKFQDAQRIRRSGVFA